MRFGKWGRFAEKEWLLLASGVGLLTTSLYLKAPPTFLRASEMEVLFLLWALFVTVKGLEQSRLFDYCASRIETKRFVALKLVVATFVLSMFVTNDVALLVIIPLTLQLQCRRRDILVILEAMAANAGSALTPFGNPQNLFLYWFYGISASEFLLCIAPFSLFFFLLLASIASLVRTRTAHRSVQEDGAATPIRISRSAWTHAAGLGLVVLCVLRALPLAACLLIPIYSVACDRRTLRVDYALLLTFLFFFGLAEDVREILSAQGLENTGHVFVLSALLSQAMSNVPAALLFSRFTSQWQPLLWGVSVGGFGSLVASFANLIAYRLYVNHDSPERERFFLPKFLGFSYAMFLLGVGLYWVLRLES
ncbi:MAG: hypothetical protein GXP27_14085 [Planctomycetes bacterium]|nr:hypothetical protein [Planctomycetota bacterium]